MTYKKIIQCIKIYVPFLIKKNKYQIDVLAKICYIIVQLMLIFKCLFGIDLI